MNNLTKEKLLYLFGKDKQLEFLCNQIIPELQEILPFENLYSVYYEGDNVRKCALFFFELFVKNHIVKNNVFSSEIKKHFNVQNENLYYEILLAYFLFETITNPKRKNINAFLDKKSVFYTGVDFFA